MPEPILLVDKNYPEKVLAYACPKCGMVVDKTYDSHADDERYRKVAARHCEFHCSKCDVLIIKEGEGKNYPGYGTLCEPCVEKVEQERDQRRFDSAQHLTEEEWGNDSTVSMVVYLDGHDKYFPEGIEELREWWFDFHYVSQHPDGAQQPLPNFPAYVWVCNEIVGVRLDASDILENALEEHSEDAIDNVDIDALQKHLDEWCADPANQICSWEPNFKKLVLLSAEENERFIAKWREEA